MGVSCCKRKDEEIEIRIPYFKDKIASEMTSSLYNFKSPTTSEVQNIQIKSANKLPENFNFSLCITNCPDCNKNNECKRPYDIAYNKYSFDKTKSNLDDKVIKLQSLFRGLFYRRRFNQFYELIKNNKRNKTEDNGNTYERKVTNKSETQQVKFILPKSSSNKSNVTIDFTSPKSKMKGEKKDKIYNGEQLYNKKHGFGVLSWKDGTKYIGYFNQDFASGVGKQIQKTGDIFFGQWILDKANGIGYYINSNGNKYEGYWKEDKQDGFGIENWNSAGFYYGDFQDGSKNGYGILELDDGSKYEGEFFENYIHGIGIFTYNDGKSYSGQWNNNKIHGYGTMYWPNGKQFEGSFLNDMKDGFGIFYCGLKIYLGFWKSNKLEGEVCIIEGSTINNSLWKDGKRVKYLDSKSQHHSLAEQIIISRKIN